MGSHWLTLHIGSPAGIAELLEREPLATLNKIPDLGTRRFAERIMKGDYTRDPETLEHPEGNMFIGAFHALSEVSSKSRITLEIYDDDERTPELWNFIWSDWEPAEVFALPLSPFGTPAVTYKDRGAVVKYLDQFRQVQESGATIPTSYPRGFLIHSFQFWKRLPRMGPGSSYSSNIELLEPLAREVVDADLVPRYR